MSLDRLRREVRYDDWANGEVLREFGRSSAPPARAVSWFAHILGARSEWLARLEGGRSGLAVWPRLPLDELGLHQERLRSAWDRYLEGLVPGDRARSVSYKYSKGEAWSSTVEDIVTHVVLHGSYHRGQIASALRAAGLTPPYTDYIHAVRGGMLEESTES